jgi:hypothetical protein
MKLDIGRVFSNTWAMIKQRFWLLVGMWAVFFGIQAVYFTVAGTFVFGSAMAFGAVGAGLDSPEAVLGGLGIGVILLGAIFYIGYFVILFASQAASAILGSPIESGNFGEALGAGFKSGLTLLGVTVLMVILYLIFVAGYSLIFAALSFLGDAAGLVGALLFIPVGIYLALRFAVLMPVVAVERVFNPITAIRRTWEVTSGNVLGILLVTIVAIALALVFLGIPFFVIFGAAGAASLSDGDPSAALSAAAIGSMLVGFLLFLPLYVVYSIVSVVINSCLHAELTDADQVSLEDTFS